MRKALGFILAIATAFVVVGCTPQDTDKPAMPASCQQLKAQPAYDYEYQGGTIHTPSGKTLVHELYSESDGTKLNASKACRGMVKAYNVYRQTQGA